MASNRPRNTKLTQLKKLHPESYALAQSQVPVITLGQPEHTSCTVASRTLGERGLMVRDQSPGVRFYYTDHTLRTKTYRVLESGELEPTCTMCQDGFRPEYSYVDKGMCWHCAGSNIGTTATFTTVAQAADNFRQTCQRDLTSQRRIDVCSVLYADLCERYVAQHPDFAAALRDHDALVEAEVVKLHAEDAGFEGDLDYYRTHMRSAAEQRVRPFLAELRESFERHGTLTDRQREAFAKVVHTIVTERAQVQDKHSFAGQVGERLRTRAKILFTKILEGDYGDRVLVIAEGEGTTEGARLKTFSSGAWAFKAHEERWRAQQKNLPMPELTVQVSATVKNHQTCDRYGNTTVLGNVRTINKL